LDRSTRKAATRAQLKDAARACFAETGLEGTRIGAITRAAGVAHGTFYVHFPSKEALVDELLLEFNLSLVETLGPLWDPDSPLGSADRVRATAEVFLDTLSEQRAFVVLYAQRLASGLRLETLADGINPQAADFLATRLAEVAATPGQAPPSLGLAAHGLLALWIRIGLHALLHPEIPRRDAIATLVHMTLGAVFGPPDPLPGDP